MRKFLFLAVAAAAVTFVTAAPNSVKAQGTAYYYPTPAYGYPYGQAYYGYAPAYYGYAPAYGYSYGQNLPPPIYYQYGVGNYGAGSTAWGPWDRWERMHGYNR